MKRGAVSWRRITAEFLAIFAGVTLSLLAEDWRQDREDRKREVEFLSEVSLDLAQDSVELGALLGQMEAWDAASLWVNRNVDRNSVPRDSVFQYLRRFGIISFYQPVRSGYLGLRDAGLLHVLRDGEVRRGIVDYYEVQQPYMEQFFGLVHESWARWYRVSAPHIDWVAPEDRESMWVTVRNGIVTSEWKEILADDAMRGHMDWAGLIGGNTASRIHRVLARNSSLRKLIAGHTGTEETTRDSTGAERGP